MKPSLQLKISQSLAMTPQLQQAIRLLQLSTLELQTEIQNALDSNMMLELDEGDEEETANHNGQTENNDIETGLQPKDDLNSPDIPEGLPVDAAWDDIYDTIAGHSLPGTDHAGEFYENQRQGAESLSDHLHWQLNLIPLSETDRAIAVTIIDMIDKDGYLTGSLEDILPLLNDEMDVDIEELNATLHLIQNMEPAGVGARDLQECLALQLSQQNADTPWLRQAREIVTGHMDLL
ncbi:MAG: RNA polymerase factor sigma-54, partial [Gammaproteobacteria bacterium]